MKNKYLFIEENMITYLVDRELTIDDMTSCADGYLLIINLNDNTELVDGKWIPIMKESDMAIEDEV